jgi:hypothetical protein
MRKKWTVRVSAEINDDIEVEAETEDEAKEEALANWRFCEASSWKAEIMSAPEETA